MTKARQEQISLTDTPYYHCTVRCVRRAFLCGYDKVDNKNYDHRKQWIVDRFKELTEIFSIDICAYAVMSNHYHLVLHIDQEESQSWNKEQIIERWTKLFNGNVLIDRYRRGDNLGSAELAKVEEITQEWRQRLTDISWFMRCMNESIAVKANREDNCKGRFWEGRFKSQALLDETALLSCMIYVDLNPIRAKMAESLEESEYTSIHERIQTFAEKESQRKQKNQQQTQESKPQNGQQKDRQNKTLKTIDTQILLVEHRKTIESQSKDLQNSDQQNTTQIPQPSKLLSFNGNEHQNKNSKGIQFSPLDYLELADWTGRAIREDKRGHIPPHIKPILQRLGINQKNWLKTAQTFGNSTLTATGAVDKLKQLADRFNRKWLKGVGVSKELYAT